MDLDFDLFQQMIDANKSKADKDVAARFYDRAVKTDALDENGLPVFKGDVVPVKPVCDKPHAIAFAGIGRPQKFYQSLEDCGITLVKTKDFSDHHFYSREELMQLINEAKELNAALFTTSLQNRRQQSSGNRRH